MRLSTALLVLAIAPVARSETPRILVKPEAFPTLVNPNCSHCVDEAKRRAGELKPDDPVLAWTRGYSDGGAIPIRFFLNTHRVISDSYGVFVYDPDAGYARGFAPGFHYVFHGWRNGVMTMKDTTDGTLYSCLSGIAFDGPRKGERLKTVPTLVTTWGDVMTRNPNAVAYHMFEKYKPTELPKEENADAKATRGPVDNRLDGGTEVLGVRVGHVAKAYPLAKLAEYTRDTLDGVAIVILKRGTTAAAYRPIARQPRKFLAPRPDKNGVSPPDAGTPLPDGKELAAVEITDFTTWDVDGRSRDGGRRGWTLEPVEAVQCRWFAWSAEFPGTELQTAKVAGDQMIAGTSEFLKILPKPFGTVKAVDTKARTVTIVFDGETVAKVWPLEPDAELKVAGWWGRLEQFRTGQRVWTWLKLNRNRQPVGIAMLADELSEWDMHGSLAKPAAAKPRFAAADVESKRAVQKDWLRENWKATGLPGTLTFHHVFSGELELMLDHEAMRWARSLRAGDTVTVATEPAIRGVVKTVAPWRERTQVRLVVGELESADLKLGSRLNLKMTPPAKAIEDSPYPPDIGLTRTKGDRIEWFLASAYCVCGVGKDTCTGMFYTLASCNPNGCGAPAFTRDEIGKLIDSGKTDREIWDALLTERGPTFARPHLRP